MKILLFGNRPGGHIFFRYLYDMFIDLGHNVDMLDWGECTIYYGNLQNSHSIKGPVIANIIATFPSSKFRFLSWIIKVIKGFHTLEKNYDVVNIHFGNSKNILFIPWFKKCGRKVIVSMWGSDFYCASDKSRKKAEILYNIADIIHFSSPGMRNDFVNYYHKYSKKTYIANMPMYNIEILSNMIQKSNKIDIINKLEIPKGSFIITCGYKAMSNLQHKVIIDALSKAIDLLPENYLIIFPMTYGEINRDVYIKEIELQLQQYGLKYIILRDYLDDTEMMMYRYITELYITIPTSDQLSSTLIEHLLSGNVTITGDWLPYSQLDNLGVFYIKTDLGNLTTIIRNTLEHFGYYKKLAQENKPKIYNTFSLEVSKDQWNKMLNYAVKN